MIVKIRIVAMSGSGEIWAGYILTSGSVRTNSILFLDDTLRFLLQLTGKEVLILIKMGRQRKKHTQGDSRIYVGMHYVWDTYLMTKWRCQINSWIYKSEDKLGSQQVKDDT